MKNIGEIVDRVLGFTALACLIALMMLVVVNGFRIVENADKLQNQLRQNFEHRSGDIEDIKQTLSRLEKRLATTQPN
jgi:uncharacterized membrane protein YhiD involved in acid resistance